MKPVVILAQTGCLLPVLIFFNLFFGWMFFRLSTWLFIEIVLVILFILNAVFVTKKVFSSVSQGSSRPGAIDVEAEVVDEKKPPPEVSS